MIYYFTILIQIKISDIQSVDDDVNKEEISTLLVEFALSTLSIYNP